MKKIQRIASWAGGMLLALSAGEAFAFTQIDTMTGWNGTDTIQPFGIANTATYGQVVTAPPGETTLSSFSFEMNIPATVAFRGEVYAWDGVNSRASGAALYESAPMQTAGTGFQVITFTIPAGVPVVPGQQYVIFATNTRDQAGHSGSGPWAARYTDVYPGGTFVYLNNGTDPTQWTTVPWSAFSSFDGAFRATFGGAAPVPTPPLSEYTMMLVTVLLALTGFVFLRRRGN